MRQEVQQTSKLLNIVSILILFSIPATSEVKHCFDFLVLPSAINLHVLLSRKLIVHNHLLQVKDDASREEAERAVLSSLKKYAICLLMFAFLHC